MKKRNIIILCLILLWLACSIGAVLLINNYIEEKEERLRSEIRESIRKIFEGQSSGSFFVTFNDGFFDTQMHNGRVKNFQRASFPPKPNKKDFTISNLGDSDLPDFYESAMNDWTEQYADLSSLWDLDLNPYDENFGWMLKGIRCYGWDDSYIHTFNMFPYQVGIKKSNWQNYYTVPTAVEEAFEFYTTNSKSNISDRYRKGSSNTIWNKIYECENEYFGIYETKGDLSWHNGESIPNAKLPKDGGPVKIGSMHNGYYRVFIAATQETHYKIDKRPSNPDIKERNKLVLWCLLGLSIVFITPLIILICKKIKEYRIINETIKDRLIRKCNPTNFMSNYEKIKIDWSNELFKEISNTDNQEQLIILANKAQKKLSISLIESWELEELRKKCNPSKFIKRYDSEKVSLANEIYSILSNPNLSYSEFLDARNKANELLK